MAKSKSKSAPKKATSIDWVPPYPPPDPEVLVLASVNQDIMVHRTKGAESHIFKAGTTRLIPSDVAHSFAANLGPPEVQTEE